MTLTSNGQPRYPGVPDVTQPPNANDKFPFEFNLDTKHQLFIDSEQALVGATFQIDYLYRTQHDNMLQCNNKCLDLSLQSLKSTSQLNFINRPLQTSQPQPATIGESVKPSTPNIAGISQMEQEQKCLSNCFAKLTNSTDMFYGLSAKYNQQLLRQRMQTRTAEQN